jgi:DNA replication protein DnaC
MLATTNYNAEGLREVYGERVSERIFEMMDVWSYNSKSKRYL